MNTTDISESLEPGPLLGLGSSAVLGPEVAARTLVERLRFLASGKDDPHSVAIDEAADAIERMQNWLEGDCYCPCCTGVRECAEDCTLAADDPNAAERMAGAREALFGA